MEAGSRFAAVTGAGSGIGRAASEALARAGFTVALIGRREQPLSETRDAIEAAGGRAEPFAADIADAASVDDLFDQWRRVVDVNLTGVFLCARAAYRLMKSQSPQGGRIINNGSISAHSPRPHTIAYTATKHAVTGITKSIALEGRPYHIACSQIDIGNAATSLTERMTRGVLQADGRMAPEARMDVSHVADAVVHMASLPVDVNILSMTLMATAMPFVGRG